MNVGTILLIHDWPVWEICHGHPAIVWSYLQSENLFLLLPISHNPKYLVKGLKFNQFSCRSAYKPEGPMTADGQMSYVYTEELAYERHGMPRTKRVDSGLGVEFDEVTKKAKFPYQSNHITDYSKVLTLDPGDFIMLQGREQKLSQGTERLG